MITGVFSSKIAKISVGVVGSLLIGLGFLWWNNASLRDSLSESQSDVRSLQQSLEVTEQSVNRLMEQSRETDRIVRERREERKQTQQEIENLRQSLNEARQTNEALEDCINVDLGDYADSLQQQSSRRSEGGED